VARRPALAPAPRRRKDWLVQVEGKVDCALIDQLADLSFTEGALNAGFIGGLAPAPVPRAQGLRHAPAPRALVAPGSLTLRLRTGLAAARPAAVAVAAVTVAAQHDLHAAAHAQVQSSGSVHAHPATAEVLDGLVPARRTAVALPSLVRCGHLPCR
jgi:hypothetical protein